MGGFQPSSALCSSFSSSQNQLSSSAALCSWLEQLLSALSQLVPCSEHLGLFLFLPSSGMPGQGAKARCTLQGTAPCPPFCSHPTALMKSCVLVGFLGLFFFKSWCTIVNGQVTRTALEFLSVLEGLFVTGQKIPPKSSKKKSSLFNFWGDLKDSRCLRKNLDLCYL